MSTGGTFGHLQEFSPESETIGAYLERVQHYFDAHKVDDELRIHAFSSVIGSKTYSLLRNQVSPDKPGEKSLQELFAVLRKYFELKKLSLLNVSGFSADSRRLERRSLNTKLNCEGWPPTVTTGRSWNKPFVIDWYVDSGMKQHRSICCPRQT